MVNGTGSSAAAGDGWHALVRYRWTVPLLAELQRREGSKFVTLVNALGAGRSSVRQSLDALIELGLARRNPGYGHPLRPEYLPAGRAVVVGEACGMLAAASSRLGADETVFRRWTLPVVLALAEGAERFGEVRASLPAVTPRALSLALKRTAAAGLVERTIDDGYPPVSRYRLTEGAVVLVLPLRAVVESWETLEG
jgi:DNA-binding HxlR family transcriptional regulator